ncbi:MAG: tetratricopeptide repeat protein [Prevotellaceae bacterium]|jgi:TolA-binding protein|nr:tetratricopeptide repeat protein [Prevotellaceae bacterium]
MLKSVQRIAFATFLLSLVGTTGVVAQATRDMGDAQEAYRHALELYEKKLYGLAQHEFERAVAKGIAADGSQLVAQVEYYKLVCAYELWASNTEELANEYIAAYPESEKCNDTYYLLGKYYFRNADYANAITAFGQFNSSSLSEDEMAEYDFKRAYSLFAQLRYETASPIFSRIKDGNSKYASAATYYYSHIAYDQRRYAVALRGFESLRNDEVFSKLVPYYILHIYHSQQNYDKVISEGSEFVESVTGKRLPEIARIVGEAYYYKKQYDKALPFIEKYAATATTLTRQDRYLVGYIYYQNKDYQKASKIFEQIVVGQDSLAQSAYYYLADSWLQMGDKYSAGRVFLQASKMDFFPDIKEDALFNYAKLMFDLNSGPFNDAIEALNLYLKQFPNSRRTDEVNKFLMQAYVVSRNYKAALESLSAIKSPDADALAAMQKVAYYHAIELFQNQSYKEAIDNFNLSLKYASYSPRFAALATYWKADAEYRLGNYETAGHLFNEFVLSPGVVNTEEYIAAHYNLGYATFKQREYSVAMQWFRKYASLALDKSSMLCDTYNRMGDCSFMQHNYAAAIDDYSRVMQMKLIDVDYAAFQCGLCYGLVQQMDKKIELMDAVINFRPTSPHADHAMFEKGRTYTQQLNYAKAIVVYTQLLGKKQSAFYAKSLVELGLISVNQGNNTHALEYYKRTVTEFPGTSEARNAMLGIKNIYVELGDVDTYFKYAGTVKNFAAINASEKDSITFSSAELAYNSGNTDRAIDALNRYLDAFPNGAFVLDANFYIADCYYRTGKLEESLPHFVYVLSVPKNDYTEPALLGASRVSFDLGEYKKASSYYERLESVASSKVNTVEAKLGKMRSDYLLQDYVATVVDATSLLAVENLPAEIVREAYYKRAKSYDNQALSDKAVLDYKEISSAVKTKEGAEARYKVVADLFKRGDLANTEQAVLDFSKQTTPHQYWMAKCFIVLGDVYVQRNDAFQAKATYESIIDGYKVPDDGIIDEVNQRMQQLIQREKEKENAASQSPYDVAL